MRKALRFAEPKQKQQLQPQLTKTLKVVMEQIKQDLKLLVSSPPEHANHINFVRSIVAIIRAQDICPVDPYFYQISPEYSPSRQDPRLQTAGILACGLKLEEGNVYAASSLFYLLWPNFTTALANGRLGDEQSILEQGMQHPHVFSFMLGKMLPAIIRTAVRKPEGWVLIETYVDAFEKWLAGPAVHKEVDEENMDSALTLLKCIEAGVRHLQSLDITDLHTEHLYTLIQMFKLLNLLGPSLSAYVINNPTSRNAESITQITSSLAEFSRAAGSYISDLLEGNRRSSVMDVSGTQQQYPFTLDPARLFEGMPLAIQERRRDPVLDRSSSSSSSSENIDSFSAHMLREIGQGWITIDNNNNGSATLTVKGPATRGGPPPSTASTTSVPATQSGLGTPVPRWDAKTLVSRLREEVGAWGRAFGGRETGMGLGMGIRMNERGWPEQEQDWVRRRGGEKGRKGGTWESRWAGEVDCLF